MGTISIELMSVLSMRAGIFPGQEKMVKEAVRSLTKQLVRRRVVDEGLRIDGRGTADLRPGRVC